MDKVNRTPTDLQSALDEQINFLIFSAQEYDNGREAEALRLAVTLRLLLHDTRNSHSLLSQMNRLDVSFWDTSWPNEAGNLMTTHSLVSFKQTDKGIQYGAHLDDMPFLRQEAFSVWWTNSIFIDAQRREMSRRDLVLITANQDGGAHFDPAVDKRYFDLEFENSLAWQSIFNGQEINLGRPGRIALRQISHEVLKTLIPNYAMIPNGEPGIWLGGARLVP